MDEKKSASETEQGSRDWRSNLNDVLSRKVGIWPLVLVVALVQSAVLGYMIWDRVTLLRTGQEVVLDVVPVDPRSLFRGDYVILNYKVSSVEKSLASDEFKRRDRIYVTLKKNPDVEVETDDSTEANETLGRWRPVALSAVRPASVANDEVVLKAEVVRPTTIRRQSNDKPIPAYRLKYGVESYFVEEGAGKVLEKQIAEKKIEVVLAVAKSGKAAVKALQVDGARIYDEPLF